MNLLQLSWKNLINKPLAMTLSLVLFALGVGLISLLFILNKQLEDQFKKNLAGIDLVVGAKGSPLQLILSSMYHIDAPTGNIPIQPAKSFLNPKNPLIKVAIPLSMGDSHQGYRIIGTTYDIVNLYDAQLAQGNLWAKNLEVTVGATVADKLHLHIGDTFFGSHGLVIDENLVHNDAPSFKVVGIFKPAGSVLDQLILTNTQSVWEVHASHDHEEEEAHDHEGQEGHENHEDHAHARHSHETKDHQAHHAHSHNHPAQIIDSLALAKIGATQRQALLGIEESITSFLVQFKGRNFRALNLQRNINENTEMQAATPAIEITRLRTMMGTGTDALKALAYVIVFVSGLSIFISLFSSLKDRQYELALMRVMGSSRSKLFYLIILEGLILAVLGFIIGIILSHVGMSVLSHYLEDAYRYAFSGWEFLKEEWYLLGGALLIGFLAAVIPAIQASKTDISRTLSVS